MAIQKVINPFTGITGLITGGLNFIGGNIGFTPSVDILITVTTDYIRIEFDYPAPPSPMPPPHLQIAGAYLNNIELMSYLPFAINSYIYQEYNFGSAQQAFFVDLILERIKNCNPLDLADVFDDIEDNIPLSGLSQQDQIPLFLAIQTGKIIYSYFMAEISTPVYWVHFLNANYAVNLANVPNWVSVAILAAVYNFKGVYDTSIDLPPRISGPAVITALTAVLGMTAGKVIFKWVPRMKALQLGGNNGMNNHFNGNRKNDFGFLITNNP